MKKPTSFLIVRAKGRGFQILPAGNTRAQAQVALGEISRSNSGDLYVYQVQPVHWQVTTTMEWGAKRGRPPGKKVAPKTPKAPKKVKKVKKAKTCIPKTRASGKRADKKNAIPNAIRRRMSGAPVAAASGNGGNDTAV